MWQQQNQPQGHPGAAAAVALAQPASFGDADAIRHILIPGTFLTTSNSSISFLCTLQHTAQKPRWGFASCHCSGSAVVHLSEDAGQWQVAAAAVFLHLQLPDVIRRNVIPASRTTSSIEVVNHRRQHRHLHLLLHLHYTFHRLS